MRFVCPFLRSHADCGRSSRECDSNKFARGVRTERLSAWADEGGWSGRKGQWLSLSTQTTSLRSATAEDSLH